MQNNDTSKKKKKMEWPKIACFGDSVTARAMDVDQGCWGAQLASKTINYYDVDLRGYAGFNTRWGLDIMPRLFPKSYLDKVEIFILFFGHNDSYDPKSPLHCPVDEYEKNLRAMVDYLKANGVDASKIIMLTAAWYDKEAFDEMMIRTAFPPAHKVKEEAVKYADATLSIARDNNISCVDMYRATVEYQPLKSLFCDGVHLSRHGANLLFGRLWHVVEKKILNRHGKKLEDLYHFPPCEKLPSVQPVIESYRNYLSNQK